MLKFRDYSDANIDRFRNNMLDELQVLEPTLDNVNDYAQYLIDFFLHSWTKISQRKLKFSLKNVKKLRG